MTFWCCCAQVAPPGFEIDFTGIAQSPYHWTWWTPGTGEQDPLPGSTVIAPTFTSTPQVRQSRGLRFGRSAALGGIPSQVYSSVVLQMYGYATDAGDTVTPGASDHQPKLYDIYAVNRVLDVGGFVTLAGEGGIDRSALLGPISWDESATDWSMPDYRVTPNLASIVNPVVALPGWNADSLIHLVFDMFGQEATGIVFAPPGRTLNDGSGANRVFFV